MRSHRGLIVSVGQAVFSLIGQLEQRAFARRSRREAEARKSEMRNATPSTQLGHGRLAGLADASAARLLDKRGLFLGALDGKLLFYNGDSHLISYARNGAGKGVTVIQPNLAHARDRSLVVIDLKDGELAFSSHEHRSRTLDTTCVYLNPFGLHGLPNTRINPLRILIEILESGGSIDTEADEIALTLIPVKKSEGGSAWVYQGARRVLALVAEFHATFHPDDCTLGGLWRFMNASDVQIEVSLYAMVECGIAGIAGRAAALLSTLQNAAKQWESYKSQAIEALAPFEPGKAFERATSAHEFDFGDLKSGLHTVYLMTPSEKIGVASIWISLITNYAIEAIARKTGPVRTTFIMDEFPQLPRTPAVLKGLRLYRGRGLQFWIFAQGRFSMEGHWSRDEVREFEDQAPVFQTWSVEDPELLRDVTLWSGTATVSSQSFSKSGGVVESAGENLSESKRAVLQTEDIRSIGGDGRQIIRLAGCPYLLVCDRVPYFAVDPWASQLRDVRTLHLTSGEENTDGQ